MPRKVQAVLLDDAVGALMVLFPQSQLLDLNRLAELTGRRLTAVPPSAWKRCSASTPEPAAGPAGTDQLAVPVRRKPAARAEAADQLGRAGLLLEITSEAFKTMLTKASAASFGEP
jgi:prolyl-tRNA editing enzyme YbaK/EbsC (Cys-tRNA(Pro) deacylase)